MVIGILVSLALLTWIAFRGFSVILFAPLCALVAALTAGLSPMPTYSELFMNSAGTYVKNFFPIFLLGAVFGKVMEDSGMARSIAGWIVHKLGTSRAVISIVIAASILTYGGVSLFVVGFAVYPFANAIFQEANFPRRLIPGCIALGAFGCTMTAIPGTPQIQNMIPTKYFGTDAYAAPVFGLVGAALIYGLALAWLEWRKHRMVANGEGFGAIDTRHVKEDLEHDIPDVNPGLAALPLIITLVLNYVMTKVISGWDPAMMEPTSKLALASKVIPVATWALIIALVAGILAGILISARQFKVRGNLMTCLNAGTIGSLLAIMNTASEVGYGNIISSLPGFTTVKEALMGVSAGNPLISEFIMVNLLAGITGSASGGMSIALETMGQYYMDLAVQNGISVELLHRVASMASGGFDTMPHNGAVITLLAICGLTHKESYADIGMVSLVIPVGVTFFLVCVWAMLGLHMG